MPEIAWSDAAKFRDFIAHHYFALDAQIVWDVARHRIPEILDAARSILDRFAQDSNA
jgi:uncharacterized protein with HEPN domain